MTKRHLQRSSPTTQLLHQSRLIYSYISPLCEQNAATLGCMVQVRPRPDTIPTSSKAGKTGAICTALCSPKIVQNRVVSCKPRPTGVYMRAGIPPYSLSFLEPCWARVGWHASVGRSDFLLLLRCSHDDKE